MNNYHVSSSPGKVLTVAVSPSELQFSYTHKKKIMVISLLCEFQLSPLFLKLKVSFQSFQKASALFNLHFQYISLIDLFIVNVTRSFFVCENEEGYISASQTLATISDVTWLNSENVFFLIRTMGRLKRENGALSANQNR